jgi:hypothetical protein
VIDPDAAADARAFLADATAEPRAKALIALLTKAAERLRRGDYDCRRLGVHLSWIGDLGGWWDETDFHETRDTGFLLARLAQIWRRVPRYIENRADTAQCGRAEFTRVASAVQP